LLLAQEENLKAVFILISKVEDLVEYGVKREHAETLKEKLKHLQILYVMLNAALLASNARVKNLSFF